MLELITVQNTTIQLEVANPLALLYIAAQTCWFGKLLQATYEKYPCSDHSPWTLCIYEDEAKPGNKMKRDNRRACQNIYVSFFDFGGAALSKEDFWLTIATLRACDLKYVEGGMSQVTNQMLKLMFQLLATT